MTAKMNARPFGEAREFAQSLNLKNQKEWNEYSKSGKRPEDIPGNPNKIYKEEWKGMGDFLGNGKISHKDRIYRSFGEAKKFVQSLNLKNVAEWNEYCKSGKRPDDIPKVPHYMYKKEWKGWGDFLGTGRFSSKDSRSFEEAKDFVQSLNLKGQKEWNEYCKSGKRPDDIPVYANEVYKNKGWINWGDFLGTGNIATYNKEYRSFGEARDFVQSLNLKGQKEWREYCKLGKNPDDIPADPSQVYKGKGWISSGDFFGTNQKRGGWVGFKEARIFAQSLNLKSKEEWNEYCKSGKRPDDIPADPSQVYKRNK